MKVLITNDDGIYSPGLAALAKSALHFGEVRIMAPDVERSSASHAITAHLPISYKKAIINVDDVQFFSGEYGFWDISLPDETNAQKRKRRN